MVVWMELRIRSRPTGSASWTTTSVSASMAGAGAAMNRQSIRNRGNNDNRFMGPP